MIWWPFPFFCTDENLSRIFNRIFFLKKYFAGDFRVGFYIIQYESTYRIDKQYTNSSKTRRINDMDYFLKKIRIGIPRRGVADQRWAKVVTRHEDISQTFDIRPDHEIPSKSDGARIKWFSSCFGIYGSQSTRTYQGHGSPNSYNMSHIYCDSRNSRNHG